MTILKPLLAKPPAPPHILLYTLGNYTHPTTKHSLAQYIIPPLLTYFGLGAEKEFMRLERKFDCWVGSKVVKGGAGDEVGEFRLTIVKPRILMNLNGRPVPFLLKSLSTTFPLNPPPTLIALHDNLTLLPLSVGKLRHGVSHQGHGGLSSIESSLKTNEFWRLGLGIGRGGAGHGAGQGVAGWVLGELSREEKGFWEIEGAGRVGEVVCEMAARLGRGETGKAGQQPLKKKKMRVAPAPGVARGQNGSSTG